MFEARPKQRRFNIYFWIDISSEIRERSQNINEDKPYQMALSYLGFIFC